MHIKVDQEIVDMVENGDSDYRVCTACMGPALVTTDIKPAKPTDMKIPVGKNTIYVSRIQAQYITHISKSMIYDEQEIDACPAFYDRPRL